MKRPVLVLALLAAPAFAASADTPDAAAHRFYDYYIDLGRAQAIDGLPNAANLAKLKPIVSAKLFAALQMGAAAEARYVKATKNQSPPLLEGDPFTSMFEGAKEYVVKACSAKAAGFDCDAVLTHREKEVQDIQWYDTLVLVREGGLWKVDDIAYGGGFAFGNKGALSETLKEMDKESREAP